MFTRTKIICTMGPAVSSYEKIVELLHAGMNVARLNFSHGTHEEHAKTVALLKQARFDTKQPLAILLDMQGPKIRVGKIKGGEISLKAGQVIELVKEGTGSSHAISFHPFEVIEILSPGMTILFDDGYISGKILKVTNHSVQVAIGNPGVLKSGKGINLPGQRLPLPAMTEDDLLDLQFGCDHDVDLIAASFIRSAEHVQIIKEALLQRGFSHIPVIAKIENMEGVHNFDSILSVVDGILVARGDLGVELDLVTIPRLQKMMIRKCIEHAIVVITATHMLESMISNPRPTRAEVSDVANAIYDFSSAIMLSAETAIGKYPIEAVQIMRRIARATESDIHYREKAPLSSYASKRSQDALQAAYGSGARAIVILDGEISLAYEISSLRPSMPIVVCTTNEKHYHQLSLCWGAIPLLTPHPMNVREGCLLAIEKGILSKGDVALLILNTLFQTHQA